MQNDRFFPSIEDTKCALDERFRQLKQKDRGDQLHAAVIKMDQIRYF